MSLIVDPHAVFLLHAYSSHRAKGSVCSTSTVGECTHLGWRCTGAPENGGEAHLPPALVAFLTVLGCTGDPTEAADVDELHIILETRSPAGAHLLGIIAAGHHSNIILWGVSQGTRVVEDGLSEGVTAEVDVRFSTRA